jgi:hypothetical protein
MNRDRTLNAKHLRAALAEIEAYLEEWSADALPEETTA